MAWGGELLNAKLAELVGTSKTRALEHVNEDKVPMKRSSVEDMRALRHACGNTLKLTAVVLADDLNRGRTSILVDVSQPVETWYREQAHV